MTITRHFLARSGLFTLGAVVLVSCGESTSPLNVQPEHLQSMGDAVAAEVEVGVMQLTAGDVLATTGGVPSLSRVPASSPMLSRGLVFNRVGASGVTAARSVTDVSCGVPSQDPPVDTDGDHVPDNFSITFSLPACHFAETGSSMDITGVLRVSDPFPGTAGLALNTSLDNFRINFSGDQGSGSIFRNGTLGVAASSSGLSQSVDWTEGAQFTGMPAIIADINWTASFAAAQGQSIVAGSPLPDGTYQVNGTVGYKEGRRTAGFSITTLEPLQYSASCAAGVAQGSAMTPFTAGKVRVAVTSQEGRGYAEVTYAACNAANVLVVQQ
jgi:hypothetical protein